MAKAALQRLVLSSPSDTKVFQRYVLPRDAKVFPEIRSERYAPPRDTFFQEMRSAILAEAGVRNTLSQERWPWKSRCSFGYKTSRNAAG
jgi:hypothetical protein